MNMARRDEDESGNAQATRLVAWIAADPWRMACLEAVADLALPDAWIGAGFVRALAWDRLHERAGATPLADVDVVFHDAGVGAGDDSGLEARLGARMPAVPWSVRNQARMHRRNGDGPYRDTAAALTHWLERPTAVAARLDAGGRLELLAPFGLDDLFAMIVRPTPHARARPDRLEAYRRRMREKRWTATWPRLRVESC